MRTRRSNRGMSIIEAMVACAIMLIGFLGLVGLQLTAVRSNFQARSIAQAAAIANSLGSTISRWDYTDPRLNTVVTATNFTDTAITSTWDMGRSDTAAYQAQYSDYPANPNSVNDDALGAGFQGLATDVDRDGKTDFIRYWNVFQVDLANSGTPNGKFVQIIVRWKEPNYGFRQVSSSAFKVNPAAALQ